MTSEELTPLRNSDDTAELVRSVAVSSSRLWEEVLDRLDRMERAQADLIKAFSVLRAELPARSSSDFGEGLALGSPIDAVGLLTGTGPGSVPLRSDMRPHPLAPATRTAQPGGSNGHSIPEIPAASEALPVQPVAETPDVEIPAVPTPPSAAVPDAGNGGVFDVTGPVPVVAITPMVEMVDQQPPAPTVPEPWAGTALDTSIPGLPIAPAAEQRQRGRRFRLGKRRRELPALALEGPSDALLPQAGSYAEGAAAPDLASLLDVGSPPPPPPGFGSVVAPPLGFESVPPPPPGFGSAPAPAVAPPPPPGFDSVVAPPLGFDPVPPPPPGVGSAPTPEVAPPPPPGFDSVVAPPLGFDPVPAPPLEPPSSFDAVGGSETAWMPIESPGTAAGADGLGGADRWDSGQLADNGTNGQAYTSDPSGSPVGSTGADWSFNDSDYLTAGSDETTDSFDGSPGPAIPSDPFLALASNGISVGELEAAPPVSETPSAGYAGPGSVAPARGAGGSISAPADAWTDFALDPAPSTEPPHAPVPPPPPGFAAAPAPAQMAPPIGMSAQPTAYQQEEPATVPPITPDFFARAGRRRK